jgi:hypothetical protein
MRIKYYGFVDGESFEEAKKLSNEEGHEYRSLHHAISETINCFHKAAGVFVEHFDGSVEEWNLDGAYVRTVHQSFFDQWYNSLTPRVPGQKAALRIAFNAGLNQKR